jgi:hypothetical protein
MVISAYFDESGKFQNPLISLAGVAGNQQDLIAFYGAWGKQLKVNGLQFLTMKEALNHKRPLSAKVKVLGVENRTLALYPSPGRFETIYKPYSGWCSTYRHSKIHHPI